MRISVFVLVVASAVSLAAQTPAPSTPEQRFQFSPRLPSQTQPFKLQMDDKANTLAVIVRPLTQEPAVGVDPGIVKHPIESTYAIQPGIAAMRQDLYPGLKIQPTELASVTPPALSPVDNGRSIPVTWAAAKMIPIPITWPDVKVIPIPRSVDGFKAVDIRSNGSASRAGK